TNHRLGRLPLVEGMPVMITLNYDVSAGIVNGLMGSLLSVQYIINSNGNHEAISCVVKCPNVTGHQLPSLDVGDAAVLQDTVNVSFVH
ncbi:hypothetical protein AGABI2DRAFT_56707, partial [Agaricus bisporus var. bisporus H97]|uniref:hypothetical protein n=1 Tax=Agaricus bisporus var. bisporus (strain H97 / ATCC MYA-4626 / FGSC 10389) TaxID=936046 RepID=UPI00029F717B